MKKIIFVAALFALSFHPVTKNTGVYEKQSDKYCAKKKNGKTIIMHRGTKMVTDVTLSSGIQIKTNGVIIMENGAKMILKEGECINPDGSMSDKRKIIQISI